MHRLSRGVVSQSNEGPPKNERTRMFARLFAPTLEVSAHCDLPCGVYDPAQARIEAESIKAIIAKVADNDDPDFRTRAILIKEQRSELVKHHLWVLWTDYFKPPHFEKYPQLHTLVNEATKLAGATGTKGELDAGEGRRAARQDRRDRRDLLGDQEGLSAARPSRSRSRPATCDGTGPPGTPPGGRSRLVLADRSRTPPPTAKDDDMSSIGATPARPTTEAPAAPTSSCGCPPTAPTSRCCAPRRPAWPPASTSRSTTSRTCASPSARPARWCSPRGRRGRRPAVPLLPAPGRADGQPSAVDRRTAPSRPTTTASPGRC